jgi:TonB-linked SusC/RagA family outer membrane protein
MPNCKIFRKSTWSALSKIMAVAFLALLSANEISAQKLKQISGTVRSSSGPLSGVSITSKKNSKTGTATDANGHYVLNVREGSELIFSSIGYKTVEMRDNGTSVLDVIMDEDNTGLSDVVVIGYGTQKKSSLTSSVSDIAGKDLNNRSVANAPQALQGLAAGVTVIDGGGSPGKSNATIRIRGITSLVPPVTGSEMNSGKIIERSGLDPLFIIDGIEQSLQDINPIDIESISVLKDAASTAIYGSRAANGVVLVTTKRGKAGKVSVNLNSYYAIQKAIYNPSQMGMEDYMNLQNVAYENAGEDRPFTDEEIQTWVHSNDRIKYPVVNDWINVLLKPAPQLSNTLSVGGGTDKFKTLLSVNYFDQDGIIPNASSNQKSIRLNTDYKVSNRITLSGDFNYRLKNYTSQIEDDGENMWKLMWASSNFAVPRYPDGTYGLSSDGISPLAIAELKGTSKYESNNGLINLKADIELFKGLNFQTQYGITINSLNEKTFHNAYEIRDYYNKDLVLQKVSTNSLLEARNYSRQTTLNNLLIYKTKISDHSIGSLFGYSQISYNSNFISAFRTGFYNNNIQAISQGSLASRDNSGDETTWGLRSYFGRLNYNFAEKYFVELNARYDGSSRFTGKNRYSFFPSFSGAWRISKESFWSNLKNTVNEFKIRGSWGSTGNQSVGLYSYLETLAARNYSFGGASVQGLYQSMVANSNLTWETTTEANLGLDAQFLKGRLGVTFDIYKKKTDGILLYLPIPATIGLAAPAQNAGNVENKGWELSLTYRSAATNDLRYSLTFNLSDVKNKITNLEGTGPYINEANDLITIRKEGLPIDAFIGYKTDGFFKSEAEIQNYPTLLPNTKPGDLKYVDINNDGTINADDLVYIGSNIPHYTFGLNANIDYKNFDVNIFFQGVAKAEGISEGAWREAGNWQSFTLEEQKDYWTPQNPNAKFPRPEAFGGKNSGMSDFWMFSTAYLKLKNLQIGYTLPKSVISKLHLERCRLYISGSNLLTISPATKMGLDPEFPIANVRYYPQLSLYTAGINLTF